LGDNSDIVNGKTSTFIHILTGYWPTPPSFSLTAGRKHRRKDIKLVEELSLGFLAGAVTIALSLGFLTGAVTIALSLGLLAGVVAKTLILSLRHLK
jgi:hypothetical protein